MGIINETELLKITFHQYIYKNIVPADPLYFSLLNKDGKI